MSDYETLLLETSDGVATLTLNRPDRYNAFDATMVAELPRAWAQLRDDADVRAVVLTGAGDAAFCTGIDRDAVPACLLYTSPSPRDRTRSRMPSSA